MEAFWEVKHDGISLQIFLLPTGDVVLKDLKLKAEALNALNLPVTVKAGFVGTITLKVAIFISSFCFIFCYLLALWPLEGLRKVNPSFFLIVVS